MHGDMTHRTWLRHRNISHVFDARLDDELINVLIEPIFIGITHIACECTCAGDNSKTDLPQSTKKSTSFSVLQTMQTNLTFVKRIICYISIFPVGRYSSSQYTGSTILSKKDIMSSSKTGIWSIERVSRVIEYRHRQQSIILIFFEKLFLHRVGIAARRVCHLDGCLYVASV